MSRVPARARPRAYIQNENKLKASCEELPPGFGKPTPCWQDTRHTAGMAAKAGTSRTVTPVHDGQRTR